MRRQLIIGGIVVVGVGVLFGVIALRADVAEPASNPGTTGRIAFHRHLGSNLEVFSMRRDGTDQRRLTNDSDVEGLPDWSPSGAKIAFEGESGKSFQNFEIFTMNADGSGITQLTNNNDSDADGTGTTRLTNVSGLDRFPEWSPDGTHIAFDSTRDGNFEVYVMNADGTGQTRLTSNPASDRLPAWSPTGSKIAFTSTRSGADAIWVMKADGTGLTQLTSNPDAVAPDWTRFSR
jgi:Tol biopolymer transport system component